MELFNTLRSLLENLEEKHFIQYNAILLGGVFLISSGILVNYYRTVKQLKSKIKQINDEREQIRDLLSKAQQIQKQKSTVQNMLEEEINFKIAGYFKDRLQFLKLLSKETSETPTREAKNDSYDESSLNAHFSQMTMKELTELLYELAQNNRIFIKVLDIARSKKNAGLIDVTITIATLQPKLESPEPVEYST